MKKSLVILIIPIVIFGLLFVVDHIKMQNNEPVVFWTWGKKYFPPAQISPETAVENVKRKMDDKSKSTITNYDNPMVEEVVLDKETSIYLFDDRLKNSGKCAVYKITFNTTQDGLLGPMVFYVDKHSGELVGMGFRE